MSDFHYVRTMGADGGVDVCSGQAIGEDLETVLADGLPPFNITLQLMAGLCEILDITDEDSAVHGNLELQHVFIDDTGAISIEAFGQRRTIAPEGKPKGHATDLYGLGSLAFRLFSGQTLPALPRDDVNNHDDRVIDAILAIDFEGLNEDMVGDVQWYIAKLLSFDREDRPTAVETWRTFVAFADESPGPDFVYWCLEALEGRGERRNGEGSAAGLLDGPTVSKGPLNRGGLNFGGAAAEGTAFFTKADMKAALERSEVADQTFKPAVGGGSASSYWTKDQLRAMADGSGDAPRPKRAVGEGKKRRTLATTNTAVQAVREERAQQSQGKSTPSKAQEQPRQPSLPPHEPAPPPPKPPHATVTSGTEFFPLHPPPDAAELTVRMNANQVRTTRPTAPSPEIHRPPSSPGSIPKAPPPPGPSPAAPPSEVKTTHLRSIQQPLRDEPTPIHSSQPAPRQLPIEPPVPAYQPVEPELEEEEGSAGVLILAGIALVVAISVVACFGVGGMGAVLAFFGASTDTIEIVQPIDPPDPEPALPLPVIGSNTEPPDPAQPTKPTPVPDRPTPVRPAPTRPTPTRPTPTRPTPTRPTPTRPTPTRPTPTPTPTPTPESTETPEVNPNVPVTLTLRSSGRGKLNCPSVGTKRFDGNTALNIEPYQLPATCVVEMDNKRAAFQVYATGMVTCNLVNSEVSCDKARVP